MTLVSPFSVFYELETAENLSLDSEDLILPCINMYSVNFFICSVQYIYWVINTSCGWSGMS